MRISDLVIVPAKYKTEYEPAMWGGANKANTILGCTNTSIILKDR